MTETSQIFAFYIVTKPTKESTLEDICFFSSPRGFVLQSLGGLDPDDIFGMYLDGQEAEEVAKDLINLARKDE